MRRSLPLLVLLLATSCGQENRGGEPQMRRESPEASYDAAPAPASESSQARRDAAAGPDVSPTAAPGVAFNYRYSFRLPAERIAQVQEQHARTCEELGVARCRITGMRYRVVNEHDTEAMLAFKLEPTLARRFGRAGVEAVERADGRLTESEISGTDVGTSIQRAGRDIARMNEELRRIEAQLARRDLPPDERSRLEYDAQQIRQSIAGSQTGREQDQEALANTPMVFHYGSGGLVPGAPPRPSFARALEQATDNFIAGVYVLFIILVTLLPWIVLALIGWGLVRLVLRRVRAARPAPAPTGSETVS